MPFWQNYIHFTSPITRIHGEPEGSALFPMEGFSPDTGHILPFLANMETSDCEKPMEERVKF
jgi:hypothetical protein